MRYLTIIALAFALLVTGEWRVRAPGPSGSLVSIDLGTPAMAQEQRRRRSLLRALFGRREVRRREVRPRRNARRAREQRKARQQRRTRKVRRVRRAKARPRKAQPRRRARAPRRAVAATAGAAATGAAVASREVVEKQENARKVLVVGDFFADGLAWGLTNRLADKSDVVVVEKARGASGFVRDDHYDWPARLPELVEAEEPDFIVFQIGSNDRQALRTPSGNVKPRAEAWDAAYRARVDAMAKALKETGKPFLWVGVPPVRFSGMNRDFLVFNEWYKAAAEGAGGAYVDVWDGFADAEGNYSRSGPNEQGRIVTLRAKDGINLTKRGRTKLAYYAEAPVRKALGDRASTFLTSLPTINFGSPVISEQVYNPARTGKTEVVKLNDPSVYAADGLAGGEEAPAVVPELAGKPAPKGRADNWAWGG